MQQHPVPQNVTQYQFRLVGDMTLKQFLELAGGLILAWLFYSSNLIFIFKWPLAIFSIFFGVAMAFFPIEERPLDVWIINFVKRIYSPTRYLWQKTLKVPSIFSFVAHAPETVQASLKTVKAPAPAQVLPDKTFDLSGEESSRVSSLNSLLTSSPVATPHAPAARPSIKVRKLNPQGSVPTNIYLGPTKPVVKESTPAVTPPPDNPSESTIFSAPTVGKRDATVSVAPTTNITLPASPRDPNLVVGMVVDGAGRLLENSIVQIVNREGVPARAIKTNSLGQFYISTPLAPGEYLIETEKDNHTFTPQKLVVDNTVIPPLLIRAN